MRLYVVRHGEAATLGGEIKHDVDRPLTDAGIDAAFAIGRLLARTDERVELLLASPLKRASQTAKRIADALPAHPTVRETNNLSPGFRPSALLTEIGAAGNAGSIVIVGHQPDLGMFMSYLIADSAPFGCAIPPGAVAAIGLKVSGNEIDAVLEWFLPPNTLTAMTGLREG